MSRPTMKAVKDAMKALIIAVLPSGAEIKVGIDPENMDEASLERCPRLVVLNWFGGTNVSDNLCVGLGNAKQTSEWMWSVDVRVGSTKFGDDIFDDTALVLDALAGIVSEYPADDCGPLLVEEEPSLIGHSLEIPIYRLVFRHEIGP